MTAFQVVPARYEHVLALEFTLRPADELEILRTGVSVRDALERSWSESLMTKALIIEGNVGAVWGCAGAPLSGIGQPWLLTAPGFARVPVAMVRQGRADRMSWLGVFGHLENWVDATYTQACRYLETIGYTLDAPQPLPRTGALFRRFWSHG